MELKDLASYSFGAAVPGMSRSIKKETNKYMDAEEKRRMEEQAAAEQAAAEGGMKKGGKVKMSSASKRADGVATRGKTRGRMV
jgi:hypothetical protein